MNVKEAFYKLLARFDISCDKMPETAHLTNSELEDFLETKDWLHRISDDNMTRQFGECWGWSPELPKNIDLATELSQEEQQEFFKRLGDCKPRTSLSEIGK